MTEDKVVLDTLSNTHTYLMILGGLLAIIFNILVGKRQLTIIFNILVGKLLGNMQGVVGTSFEWVQTFKMFSSFEFVGKLIPSHPPGYLSDRYSRRLSMVIGGLSTLVFYIVTLINSVYLSMPIYIYYIATVIQNCGGNFIAYFG